MATAYLEIEEYLWIDETIQGNVNVAGLVFDDLIEETLVLGPEEVLTVYSDVLEETLGFAEGDFVGIHLTELSDWIAFTEQGGPPLRVRQSVLERDHDDARRPGPDCSRPHGCPPWGRHLLGRGLQ